MTDEAIPLGPPRREGDREAELPEHERDDERTAGGGLMSSGGTAIERGTDTIDGPDAQGADAGRRDEGYQFPPPLVDLGDAPDDDDNVPDAMPPGPQTRS